MSNFNVLSLGAGVQSTALYLMAMRGDLGVKLDAAIFADTQDEPQKVYDHLTWLRSLGGPLILTGTAGKLSDHLARGINSTGGRFASIPAFTTEDGGQTVGITRRQCSKEYKTEVIGRVLRREILGLAPGKTYPQIECGVDALAALSRFDDVERVDFAGKLVRDAEGDAVWTIGNVKGKKLRETLDFAQWALGKDFPANTKLAIRAEMDRAQKARVA